VAKKVGMKRYSKEEILKAVSILDIAKRSSISLERVCSGNFTHRCKCPSSEHKSGLERTGSLYIDGENNNFYCFGCGASNNVIDFYMLRTDCDFSTAILEMSEFVDPEKVTGAPSVRKKNNFNILLNISEMFRRAQRTNPDDIGWIEEVMKKTDEYMIQIDRYDVKKTKALSAKIFDMLKRRFS
jgi:DNA primase